MAMYTIATSGHEGEFDVFPELLGHIVCMKFEHRVAHAMSGHRLGLLQPRSVLHRLRAQVARHASSSNTNPGSKSGFSGAPLGFMYPHGLQTTRQLPMR